MKVLITGANGFVGKNLQLHLAERQDVQVVCFTRSDDVAQLPALLKSVDFVFHLAGVNRPHDPQEFITGNVDLTQALCRAVCAMSETTGKKVPMVYTSSTQVGCSNLYGQSKLEAEDALLAASRSHQLPVHILRLPNVFGKWCKPNYNSVVATFCHNIANDLPIQINDSSTCLRLVYVDDVVSEFLHALDSIVDGVRWGEVTPGYTITLGELAAQIEAFKNCRSNLLSERVGTGLVRALYATYVSYLPPSKFAYDLPRFGDERGVFVEMLKTPDSGQFSYFTAHPGVTRGGHYHHSKTEKFLVIKGHARFGFRHIVTNETYEILTFGDMPQVVETAPGWAHDITNVGKEEMIVMLWANEIFDHDHTDTIRSKV